MDWIKNDGKRPPLDFVDVKLNVDADDAPGITKVMYWQKPIEWDWNAGWSCVRITHYRHSGN